MPLRGIASHENDKLPGSDFHLPFSYKRQNDVAHPVLELGRVVSVQLGDREWEVVKTRCFTGLVVSSAICRAESERV